MAVLTVHECVQFSGALLLGRGVTDTIKSGIVDPKAFADSPEILMYGMFCALLASGTWLLVATWLELPVSTTHSIIGCALNACQSNTQKPWLNNMRVSIWSKHHLARVRLCVCMCVRVQSCVESIR